MANEKIVRAFIDLADLKDSYFTAAQSVLIDWADNFSIDHPDAAVLEQFGNDFVECMVQRFVKRFSDNEMAELVLRFQSPLFRKLLQIDNLDFELRHFYESKASAVLGVDVTFADGDGIEARGPIN